MIKFDGKEFKEFVINSKQYNTFIKYVDVEHTELLGICRPDKTKTTYICLLKCKTTGNQYTKTQNAMRKSDKCPFCKESPLDVFMDKVNVLYNGEYKVCSDTTYVNSRTKIKLEHICGRICELSPTDLLGGRTRCQCQRNTMDKRQVEDMLKEYDAVLINGEDRLYGVNERIDILHNRCGNSFNTTINQYKGAKSEHKCKFCFDLDRTKEHDTFIEELITLHNNTIITEDTYINNHNMMKFICTVCDNEWESTANNVLTGRSHCPMCSLKNVTSSKVQTMINYMESIEVDFSTEYKYDDCRNKRPLPFDFIIDNVLVEFDGEQHFKPATFDKDKREECLKERQARDRIKTKYCIDNGLTLIRIPYNLESDIEEITRAIIDGDYSNNNLLVVKSGKLINSPEIYNYLFD